MCENKICPVDNGLVRATGQRAGESRDRFRFVCENGFLPDGMISRNKTDISGGVNQSFASEKNLGGIDLSCNVEK